MGRNLDRTESALQFKNTIEAAYSDCFHFSSKVSRTGLKTESNESDEGRSFEDGSSCSSFTVMENTRENISILHTPKKDSRRKGNLPQRPRLRRTYSIHHFEPPNNYLEVSTVDCNGSGETDDKVSHPRMGVNAGLLADEQVAWNLNHFGEQELQDQAAVDDEPQLGNHSGFSCETYEDFFDAFQIDKRLLMKNSKNVDIADSAHCRGEPKSPRREIFRRSGSFPMPNKPSKLETKVTEAWPSSALSSSSTSPSSFHCSEDILPGSLSCTLPLNVSSKLVTEKNTQYETDHRALDYASNIRRYKLSRMRRVSSLNVSMERYTQLFETSFMRGAKLNISKSLKLLNEDGVGFNTTDSVFLRKLQSMHEALQVEWPSDSIEFSKRRNKSACLSSESDQSDSDVNKDESSVGCDQQLSCRSSLALTITDELQIKTDCGPNSNSQQQLSEEAIKNSINDQYEFPHEGALKTRESVTVPFNYDQHALNIIEALLRSGKSLYKSPKLNNDLDEHLLSDLVNEALHYVYIILDAYWPASLCWSSNCHLHPLPNTEQHVTRKVLSKIQKLESLNLITGNSMDDAVSFDLEQCDGWMNLHADAESLGLALDEMILDELLEELVYE